MSAVTIINCIAVISLISLYTRILRSCSYLLLSAYMYFRHHITGLTGAHVQMCSTEMIASGSGALVEYKLVEQYTTDVIVVRKVSSGLPGTLTLLNTCNLRRPVPCGLCAVQ